MQEFIGPAIEQLCTAFERGGYNPTPIIDLGVLVANADGKVDPSEREMLLEIYQTLLETKLTAEVVDHLVTASVEIIKAAGAESRARLIAEILQDCEAVEAGIKVALAVAFASEGLSDAERTVIDRIAEAAGLPQERLEEIVAEVREHVDGPPPSVRSALARGGG
jgi:tellurite resistance protein